MAMEFAITAVIALALVILFIVLLHRSQLTAAQSHADRSLPLPPLQKPGLQERSPGLAGKKAIHLLPAPPPAVRLTDITPRPAEAVKPQSSTWLERVAELKKQGKTEEALVLCRQTYPLWSAFQQASFIYRSRIKLCQSAGNPYGDYLAELYRLATVAAFCHDRVKGLPNLTLAQLRKLDMASILALPMPYDKIGYLQLRLIKKSDIRLMLALWGKPEEHLNPRQLHAGTWLAQVARFDRKKSA